MITNSATLDRYLREVVERKGSDLHLQTNSPAAIRILGEVVFLDEPPLDHKTMEDVINEVLDEEAQETLFSTGSGAATSCSVAVMRQSDPTNAGLSCSIRKTA